MNDNDSSEEEPIQLGPKNEIFIDIEGPKTNPSQQKITDATNSKNLNNPNLNETSNSKSYLNVSKKSKNKLFDGTLRSSTKKSLPNTPNSKSTNFLFKNNLESIEEQYHKQETDQLNLSSLSNYKEHTTQSIIAKEQSKYKQNRMIKKSQEMNVKEVQILFALNKSSSRVK